MNFVNFPDLLDAPKRRISVDPASIPEWTPQLCNIRIGEDVSLLDACRYGDQFALRRAMVRRLSTASVNLQDEGGKTALNHVCCAGNVSLLELLLLVPNLDVNLPDNEGNTPLHFAAQAGHVDVISRLTTVFKGQMIIDARNHQGLTPLMKAALQGRSKCARALLNAGANPSLRDPCRGLTAKEWASLCGRKSTEKLVDGYLKTSKGMRNIAARWVSYRHLSLGERLRKVFNGNSNYNLTSNVLQATTSVVLPTVPTAFDNSETPNEAAANSSTFAKTPHLFVSKA